MKNKGIFKKIIFYLFILIFAGCLKGLCLATALYNPKPMKDDLILPMPDGSVMVFRPVKVPGKSFWGDVKRIIQIGDPAGGPFEGLQRLEISGSFPDKKGDGWLYYIGKYEVTKGQFISVMGMDGFLKVTKDKNDKRIPHLKGKALKSELQKPVCFIPYSAMKNFIRKYNKWLFDPSHPERIKAMPTIKGVPGFIRLPTEIEWEYAARGGIISKEKGTFERPLPFSRSKLNKFSWHLGNARHKIRPIGLRKPNPLGIFDIFGNVQEIVDGRFLPEIWQGKPGGVPVRGGSVSTPPSRIRSSLRGEFDAIAWDSERKKVIERASFNTGFRLAIGSNVIATPQMKEELVREYESYKKGLRQRTPVGRTLDNLVAQADTQLDVVNPIMARLIKTHPELKNDFMAIQHYLNEARKRLDEAQRENARSLAQDAARNGVNFSIYMEKLSHLGKSLELAKKLSDMSTRYQAQVDAINKKINELKMASQEQFDAYVKKIGTLGNYKRQYIDFAIQELRKKKHSDREDRVLTLVESHAKEFYKDRRSYPEKWRNDFQKVFSPGGGHQ